MYRPTVLQLMREAAINHNLINDYVCSLPQNIQLTLVISTSLISNNRLPWSENLIPVLTWKSNNREQNIVEKRRNSSSFPQYFEYMSNFRSQFYIFILFNVVVRFIVFLQFRKSDMSSTDISKYFRESRGLRDNESRLYLYVVSASLFYLFRWQLSQ